MNDNTGTLEVAEATVTTEEGDAAPQLSQTHTGEEAADAGQDKVSEEIRGLKQGIVAERRARQEKDREIEALKEQIASLKNPPSDEPAKTAEDYAQLKDVEKVLAQKMEERDRQSKEDKFRSDYQACLNKALKDHDDYYDVIALADDLIQNDPEYEGYREVILNVKNGPMLAYNLGKQHPNYAKKAAAGERKKTAETIAKNLNKTQTLTGVQGIGDSTIDEVKRYKNMSGAEFEAEKRRRLGLD